MLDSPSDPSAAQAGLAAPADSSDRITIAPEAADATLAAATAKDPQDLTVLDPLAWLNLVPNTQGQQAGLPAGQSGMVSLVVPGAPGAPGRRIDAYMGDGKRQALAAEGASVPLSDDTNFSGVRRPSDAAIASPSGAAQPAIALRSALKTSMLQAQAAAGTAEIKESLAAHKAASPVVLNVPVAVSAMAVDPTAAEPALFKRGSAREPHPHSSTSLSAPSFAPWSDATATGTSPGANAVYAPGPLTPAPEAAMAQKIHYWVTRGVQSAELQLDAFAGGSVDVSIALKGDQAVVEFRTDQPEARRMLLDAMPQLKDLLAGEGLMLSGGFVGGFAQQGGGSQARENANPGAHEGIVRVDNLPDAHQALAGRKAGVVDLFV